MKKVALMEIEECYFADNEVGESEPPKSSSSPIRATSVACLRGLIYP